MDKAGNATLRKGSDSAGMSTRDRILQETAALVAVRGYHGTATRDIAAAVGIRQPSLFHHFKNKQAILAELLDRSLLPSIARIHEISGIEGSPATRLCAYVLDDLRDLVASKFDVRGLYLRDILDDPEFSDQRASWNELRIELRSLISAGISEGELRDVPPEHVERILWSLVVETMWSSHDSLLDSTEGWPESSTEIVLRGLLSDPHQFSEIRSTAEDILSQIGSRAI